MTAFLMGFGLSAQAAETAKPSKQMEQFLSFSRKSQDNFITTSVMMIGVIASQTNPRMARCINAWYRATPDRKEKRHNEILKAMHDLQRHVPTTIVLAVVERACGKFKRAPK